jgi:hypothetical protein
VAEMYLVHLQKVSNGESNKNPGFTRQDPPPPPKREEGQFLFLKLGAARMQRQRRSDCI